MILYTCSLPITRYEDLPGLVEGALVSIEVLRCDRVHGNLSVLCWARQGSAAGGGSLQGQVQCIICGYHGRLN